MYTETSRTRSLLGRKTHRTAIENMQGKVHLNGFAQIDSIAQQGKGREIFTTLDCSQ